MKPAIKYIISIKNFSIGPSLLSRKNDKKKQKTKFKQIELEKSQSSKKANFEKDGYLK